MHDLNSFENARPIEQMLFQYEMTDLVAGYATVIQSSHSQ